jgi:hypothetical protein
MTRDLDLAGISTTSTDLSHINAGGGAEFPDLLSYSAGGARFLESCGGYLFQSFQVLLFGVFAVALAILLWKLFPRNADDRCPIGEEVQSA